MQLLFRSGVALPGGINALPGTTHPVEDRFARSLIYEGRATLAPIEAPPASTQEPEPEPGPHHEEESKPTIPAIQDRDPKPINRDPARRRQGPRR